MLFWSLSVLQEEKEKRSGRRKDGGVAGVGVVNPSPPSFLSFLFWRKDGQAAILELVRLSHLIGHGDVDKALGRWPMMRPDDL